MHNLQLAHLLYLLGKLVNRTQHVKLDLCLLQEARPVTNAFQVCYHGLQCIWVLHLHKVKGSMP